MNYGAMGRMVRKSVNAGAYLFGAVWRGVESLHLYNELERLDDRELAALGITRDGIGTYVADRMEPVTPGTMTASRPVGPAVAGTAANEPAAEAADRRRAA